MNTIARDSSGLLDQRDNAVLQRGGFGRHRGRGCHLIRLAFTIAALFASPAMAQSDCNDGVCPDSEDPPFDWSVYCPGGGCDLQDLFARLQDCYCTQTGPGDCVLPPAVWQAAIRRVNAECDGCDWNQPNYCNPAPEPIDACEAADAYITGYDLLPIDDLTDEEKCFIYASFGCFEKANCDPVGPDYGFPPYDPIIPPGGTYSYPWVFNDLHGLGDPFGDTPHAAGGINLATGIYTGTEIDLSLPAPGFSWRIGRCTIPNTSNGTNYVNATETVQGFNWKQLSMPSLLIGAEERFGLELLLIDFHTEGKLLFSQAASSSDIYLPVGDFHGVVKKKTLSGVTLYEFTDQRGSVSEFFAPSGSVPGYLWRITDAHGNSAWRHHPSDPSATGIGADKVVDSAGRIYEYEYGTIGTSTRLLRVIVKTKTGGDWYGTPSGVTEIARVTYDYYTTTQSNAGVAGDLMTVTVSRKLSDTSLSDDRVRYYRYLTSGSSPALVHTLWMIVGEEGTRAYDWAGDQTFDGDYTGASDSALEPYAEKVLSYISVSDPRVDEYFVNGNCGCGGGGAPDEKYTLTFNANTSTYNDTPNSYDEEWKTRTIIEQPDGTFVTLYFDELYKMLAKVVTDADPSITSPAPKVWATRYFRNDSGRTEKECTPANVTGYTHNPSPLTIANIVPCSTTTGLVRVFDYYAGASMDELLHTARWQTIAHKIDVGDGSDDDTLVSLTWYDPEGRTIKSSSPGGLSKTQHDRLGRTTHRWMLAKTDDTNYAGVWDDTNKVTLVSGDHVLEESQSVYDNTETGGNGGQTGNVVMSASISRAHTDLANGSTGALDSNADNDLMKFTSTNITGRIQISATWYDALDRASSSCEYGTNSTTANAATFDRAAATSPPTSAVNTPVTSYTYGDDGQLKQVTDPRNKKTVTLYDALGRVRAEISNYVDGTWSSGSPGEDNIVRHLYDKGLESKLWVDLDGDNVEDTTDQITTYTYGVTKGTGAGDSRIQSNSLLKEEKYPDSSGSTDVVAHAYNALGQEIWKKDQAGNILQTDYDLLGRLTHRRATTIAGAFDSSVKRISLAYTDRGQAGTVTQYDNDTVGSGAVKDQVQYVYDDWGNVADFKQDVDSVVGGTGIGEYVTSFTYAKATPTGGHDTIRRTHQKVKYTTNEKQSLEYQYLSTGNRLDDAVSRVTYVNDSTGTPTDIVEYKYLGASQLVSTSLLTLGVSNDRFGATSAGYYQRLDPLNRIEHDVWTKGRNLYEVDVAYDKSGNIVLQEDKLHRNWGASGDPGVYDAAYTIDDRNRLVRTTEGNWGGSSIDSPPSRVEVWSNAGATVDALSQTGNWDRYRLDLNGDGDFTDTGDLDDSRTYNTVNELLTRDTDSTSGTTGNNYSPAYDAVGNLTDDAKDFKYVYDVFGRLKTIKNQSNAVVAEYEYNGLNMRTGWHYDADGDSDVDGSDPWYHFVYDERWRIVATFRGSDTSPKERFVFHNAGMNGRGGSSYIDNVILRDKDASTAWTSSSDGTCEERIYYIQNWRADVSAILSDAGIVKEWIKYSSYGVPIRIDPGDYNRDGFVNGTDYDDFADDFDNTRAEADVNFDGFVNGDDYDVFADAWENPSAAGRNVLSASSIGNRIGYAGYQHEPATQGAGRAVYHVRYRVYDAGLGTWTRKDPAGIDPNHSLYSYVVDNPSAWTDPLGLYAQNNNGGGCGTSCGSGSTPSASAIPREPLLIINPPIDLVVCCRDVQASGSGIFKHCDIRPASLCTSTEVYRLYIDPDPARSLDDGTSCSRATERDILNCLARNPYDVSRRHPGPQVDGGWLDDNCQTSELIRIGLCCLRSPWVPNWYAGEICSPCIEWKLEGEWNFELGEPVYVTRWKCVARLSLPQWQDPPSPADPSYSAPVPSRPWKSIGVPIYYAGLFRNSDR